MNRKWKNITLSVNLIAGIVFLADSNHFDKKTAIDTKHLHPHQETYETNIYRNMFTVTNSSQGTTSTTSTTVDPAMFTR